MGGNEKKDLFFHNVKFRSHCLPLLSKTYFFLIINLLESYASVVTSLALTKRFSAELEITNWVKISDGLSNKQKKISAQSTKKKEEEG